MNPAEWMAALLLGWTALAFPVGIFGGHFIAGKPLRRHRMTRETRRRMRAMRRNRVRGITLRRKP